MNELKKLVGWSVKGVDKDNMLILLERDGETAEARLVVDVDITAGWYGIDFSGLHDDCRLITDMSVTQRPLMWGHHAAWLDARSGTMRNALSVTIHGVRNRASDRYNTVTLVCDKLGLNETILQW